MNAATVLLASPRAITALASWPTFSFTSYRMVTRLVEHRVDPRTVLDVGANLGQFAVAAAYLFRHPEIHAFEPLPVCAARLRRHVSKFANVTVHQCALGSRTGEVAMHVNAHSHSSSVLRLGPTHRAAFPDAVEVDTVTVSMTTLDAEIAATGLSKPVLLKLDVQGYEAAVLEGAARTLEETDYVVVEVSFHPLYEGETAFPEIMARMATAGFRFVCPVGWLTAPKSGEMLQMDALFARK